jgi:outer membrane protein assembly factor BamB
MQYSHADFMNRIAGFLNIGLLIFAVSLTATNSANGCDDWPNWRGPNHNDQSTETGLLKRWPEGGPKQLWTNPRAGLGYAGIAIVGDQLFTMGLEDNQEFALCLNAETGEEVWRSTIGERYENNWGDGPRSTPSVDGELVYCMGANGILSCLNAASGKLTWSADMGDFGGQIPKWGYAESPLVDGNKVICTPGGETGTMLALDKKTGKKVWQTKPITKEIDGEESMPAKAHYSSVLPVNWNNRRQYIQLTVLAVIGVDSESGEVLWQSDWPGRVAVIPSPIFDNGDVFVTSGYSIGSKLIRIDDGNEPTQVWFSKNMQNHHGGVIQIGDYFYGSSDKKGFICQDRASGDLKWYEKKIKKGSVAYADGLFYHVQEQDGQVLLFKADENGREVLGKFKLSPQTTRRNPKGKIWVHPVISDGKLYLRDQEIVYCYDIKGK